MVLLPPLPTILFYQPKLHDVAVNQTIILIIYSEELCGPLAALRLRPTAPLAVFCRTYTNIIYI